MEANNAKTTSQGILAHDKATVKLTTSTSGVSLVRRHSVALIFFGGGRNDRLAKRPLPKDHFLIFLENMNPWMDFFDESDDMFFIIIFT